MSRGLVTGLSILFLLGACTHAERTTINSDGLRPLREVARSLEMTVKPTGFPKDRLLVDRDGRSFYVMAGKSYYRFMGDRRQFPGAAGIRVAGKDLLIPNEMVVAMKRDLHGASVAAPTPAPTPTPARESAPKTRSLKGLKIVIDAGHGGKDPGAVQGGVYEKNVVLPIARRTIHELKSLGVEAIATRTGDTYPSLDARVALANRRRADLFLSIHADSASRRSASGVGAFFRADGARGRQSRKLAVAVVDGIMARTGANNRRARADSRGLRVLRNTRMPAALIEVGFLTNAAERRRLIDPGYQSQIAQGIVDGIKSYVAATALRPTGITGAR